MMKERLVSPLDEFERLFFEQRLPDPKEYDSDYFFKEWRAHGNSYDLETRRKIEGKHPQLIKDTFQPKKAIDLGCGPGALMALLDEVGVKADGVDFSPEAKAAAPANVRDRISVGGITRTQLPSNSYDLVICREVLEHLTVRQVFAAVKEMVRVSSRFVYLTTRFHTSPGHLLDVTDEKKVDPTHITLLNKDLLRLMFVLEGAKRRQDIEEKLDWMKKDRVLVYEKQRA